VDCDNIQRGYNNCITHIYSSCNKCQKWSPTCLYKCMYMLDLFEKTHNSSVWRMFLTNAVQVQNDFLQPLHMIAYRLTAQQACCLYTSIKTLALIWNPHSIQLCFPLFILGMDSYKTWLAFANILSTSSGSRTHASMDWQMKNKECSSHIIQTISGDHTISYSMGIWVLSKE
jgi:hypothetical protein